MLTLELLKKERRKYLGFFSCFIVCSTQPEIVKIIGEMQRLTITKELEIAKIISEEFNKHHTYRSGSSNPYHKLLRTIAREIGFHVINALCGYHDLNKNLNNLNEQQYLALKKNCQVQYQAYINVINETFSVISKILEQIPRVSGELYAQQKELKKQERKQELEVIVNKSKLLNEITKKFEMFRNENHQLSRSIDPNNHAIATAYKSCHQFAENFNYQLKKFNDNFAIEITKLKLEKNTLEIDLSKLDLQLPDLESNNDNHVFNDNDTFSLLGSGY